MIITQLPVTRLSNWLELEFVRSWWGCDPMENSYRRNMMLWEHGNLKCNRHVPYTEKEASREEMHRLEDGLRGDMLAQVYKGWERVFDG